jgi:hypothetical protein
MPRPLRQLHDRVRDMLALGLVTAGRLEFYRAAFDLVEQGLDIIEPIEKPVGEFPEFPLGH